MLWALLMTLSSTVWAQDCEVRSRTYELANALTEAESAYLDMDEDGFVEIIEAAEFALKCLGEPITPFDAAAYHRLNALDAFLGANDGGAIAAFRSSLAAQPRYLLPSTIAPPGNPLASLYDQAAEPYEANRVALPPPPNMLMLMDGARATARPTSRPVIIQLISPDGGIAWSGYLSPLDPNPDWYALGFEEETAISSGDSDFSGSQDRDKTHKDGADSNIRVARQMPQPTPGRTRPMLLAAGGAALAAGGLYALAYGLRTNYDDPATPYSDLESLRTATNGSIAASGGLGLAALGLGVAAVITIEW